MTSLCYEASFQVVKGETIFKCIFQYISSIIVNLSFCKQMHNVKVTSHALIFVICFVELLFFLGKA